MMVSVIVVDDVFATVTVVVVLNVSMPVVLIVAVTVARSACSSQNCVHRQPASWGSGSGHSVVTVSFLDSHLPVSIIGCMCAIW